MSQFQINLKVSRLNTALYNAVVNDNIGSNGLATLQVELSNMGLNSASSKLNEVRIHASNGRFPARNNMVWDVFNNGTLEQLEMAESLFR